MERISDDNFIFNFNMPIKQFGEMNNNFQVSNISKVYMVKKFSGLRRIICIFHFCKIS